MQRGTELLLKKLSGKSEFHAIWGYNMQENFKKNLDIAHVHIFKHE